MCMFSFQEAASCALCSILSASCTMFAVWMPKKMYRISVNLARAFTRQQGMDLSVGSTKTLLHNAAMVDRFIAMSGKSPNMRLNNTDLFFRLSKSLIVNYA